MKEWRNLLHNKFLIIALIAIITVPTIYTTLFLGSMWDPYGKVNNLPVAVVNKDVPTTYEDKEINVGQKLVDKLEENDSLSFNFVDEKAAERGLENGTYYMVITIPEDFSKDATTLLDKNPEKMVLDYATNPGSNYIASKMSESALSKIQTSIANTVTKTYADTVFDQLATINDGFKEAADGSLELKDGVGKLKDGSEKISNGLNTLSDSMTTFTDGNTTLSKGLDTYLDGTTSINSASEQLASGASKLAVGANQLNAAVQEITLPSVSLTDEQKETISNTASSSVSGYSTKLSSGIGSAVSDKVTSTLKSKDTINAVSSAILKDSNITTMIAALKSAGYTEEQANAVVVGIVSNTLNGVSQNITADSITDSISPTVSSTISQIASGAAVSGAEGVAKEVNSKMSAYGDKFTTLKSSTQTLADGLNTLSDGANKLNEGSSKLVSNNSALKSGMSSLSEGANKISSAVGELSTGSSTLKDGLVTAYDGTDTLQTKLNDASVTLSDKTANISDETSEMFSNPVDSNETKITEVKDNGHAMAAYMMVVGLWVCSMAFTTVYPLTEQKGGAKSGFKLWLGKASVMYPVLIAASAVMIGALHLINGFSPENLPQTMLVAAISATAFISIVYFLNAAFGKVGQFLTLILMVIQLSGSTGTYPVQLSGDFVATITNYLPFTHAVNAFRSTISGGAAIDNHLIFLAVVSVIFMALSIAVLEFKVRHASKEEDSVENEKISA